MIEIRGKFNLSKGLVLMALYKAKAYGNSPGLNSEELSDRTGVSHTYLRERLSFWTRWRLISAKSRYTKGQGRRLYYSILSEGIRWLAELPDDQLEDLDTRLEKLDTVPDTSDIKTLFAG